jgi:hypothetical protein
LREVPERGVSTAVPSLEKLDLRESKSRYWYWSAMAITAVRRDHKQSCVEFPAAWYPTNEEVRRYVRSATSTDQDEEETTREYIE